MVSPSPRFYTEEAEGMTGQNNFYKSKKWESVRDSVLRRDGYLCQSCKRYGRLKGAAHVHHANPFEIYPELALQKWNLVSLCRECHNRMHDRESHELTAEGEKLRRRVNEQHERERARIQSGLSGGAGMV